MKRRDAGLWIDHRTAVVVTSTDDGFATHVILSNTEKHPGRVGGGQSLAPFESIRVPADDRQENRFLDHLAAYYDAVIDALRGAEAILIFGPGEAKVELEHRLARNGRDTRVVGIETVDKMTTRQVTAKVVRYFS